MTQRSTPSLGQRLALVSQILLLVGIGLVGAVAFDTVQATTAKASEAKASQVVATGGRWRGASFPVENFQAYTSPFGYRGSPDGAPGQEFHRGLDLAAPDGSYIRNWWAGKIVEVSDNSACGTSVVIQSGEWEHVYCHMKGHVEKANGTRYLSDRSGGIQLSEGQVVPAGVRIGRVGMTGRTTGPHLHWGLKYSGKWVDPALVLRAMYAEQPRAKVTSTSDRG
ncbi:MAG: M23 family metallopeptidase [Stenomitos frigidus ULC029]